MDTAKHASRPKHKIPRTPRWLRVVAILTTIIVLLMAGTGVALTLVANGFSQSGQIARNVFIERVPVAGNTVPEAIEALHRDWVPQLPQELDLTYPGGSLKVSHRDLGADLLLEKAAADAYRIGRVGSLVERLVTQWRLRKQPVHIEVECQVDEKPLNAMLADIATKVNKRPRDAQVAVGDDDEVSITPDVNGLVVHLEKSRAALVEALRRPGARELGLVVDEQQAAITAEDLSHLEVVLSRYTTRFDPGQVSRTNNLRLATETLNETVVMPGEIFSVNEIVGERTAARGYRKAPIFREGGELFDDYGGGLCQVSSTVYNAALLANMSIVERSNHNRLVTYVPLGRDAMVNYGSVDMRWRNTLEHPVLVLGRAEGDELTIKTIGKRSDKAEVRIERSNVATIPPPDKEIKDPELEEGKRVVEKKGWSGGRASVRRLVKVGDKWEVNRSYSDYYPPGPNKVRVGTKKEIKEPAIPRVPDEADGQVLPDEQPDGPPAPDTP